MDTLIKYMENTDNHFLRRLYLALFILVTYPPLLIIAISARTCSVLLYEGTIIKEELVDDISEICRIWRGPIKQREEASQEKMGKSINRYKRW